MVSRLARNEPGEVMTGKEKPARGGFKERIEAWSVCLSNCRKFVKIA